MKMDTWKNKIEYLWSLVNDAETRDEMQNAMQEIDVAISTKSIDNETYNELMMALSWKIRESYHR